MRLTIFSIKLILIGLFSQAFFKPLNILRRLKVSLLPSFLMTNGRASSALSEVVNLFWQLRHSLLRRCIVVTLFIDNPLNSSINNHLRTDDTGMVRTVKSGSTNLHSMVSCLD